jgi:hypothetical protein
MLYGNHIDDILSQCAYHSTARETRKITREISEGIPLTRLFLEENPSDSPPTEPYRRQW